MSRDMSENALKQVKWTLKGGRALGPAPFLVAGILNVTPDSFFDGGKYFDLENAAEQADLIIGQGADIIDVGGESTRPYSLKVEKDVEISRVLPVVIKILENHPRAIISIDTSKAGVAASCLDAGAIIVNDVSACRHDPGLADVIAEFKPGYVLMHCQGDPQTMQNSPRYEDVVDEIKIFFAERLKMLTSKGLPEDRIVIDPGIGFGKSLEHNLRIMRRVDEFFSFGLPVYMGLSNKSMWGSLLGLEPAQREKATQVALALMAARGVHIHRVHDVKATINSLEILKKIWS